uniref:Dehydrogenase/reductase (SDR family) member 13b.1 n=1 Tax=Astyanax mexicanus TaxID=7994 RepID=A0A8B9JB71_ASTMX
MGQCSALLWGRTEDGLGLMFEVNHLGHFLLTHLLLDRLKECGPSRIVNVSSMGHNAGNLDFNFFSTHKEFGAGDSYMNVLKTYCNSKLCNVLFTHELAKRLQGTNCIYGVNNSYFTYTIHIIYIFSLFTNTLYLLHIFKIIVF